ncbi:MAG TPA: hypothetical protein VJ836_05840 [Candidatus Saccharimonadales bacterium]|nr:hypothetical protein [Candidatus Saccharimonadales bacterium]
MERIPEPQSPETGPQLRYPEGWREILEAPDAADYQLWIGQLIGTTYRAFHSRGEVPAWAEDLEGEMLHRWQQAIELVADAAIDPEDIGSMSQAEVVETALLTLQANLDGIGWDEEGLAFTVPNMFTGEEATIDLRNLPGELPNN